MQRHYKLTSRDRTPLEKIQSLHDALETRLRHLDWMRPQLAVLQQPLKHAKPARRSLALLCAGRPPIARRAQVERPPKHVERNHKVHIHRLARAHLVRTTLPRRQMSAKARQRRLAARHRARVGDGIQRVLQAAARLGPDARRRRWIQVVVHAGGAVVAREGEVAGRADGDARVRAREAEELQGHGVRRGAAAEDEDRDLFVVGLGGGGGRGADGEPESAALPEGDDGGA